MGNRMGARPAQTAASPFQSRSRPALSRRTESCAPRGLICALSCAELSATQCGSCMSGLRSCRCAPLWHSSVPRKRSIAARAGAVLAGFQHGHTWSIALMAQWQTSTSRWSAAERLGWLSVGLGLTALLVVSLRYKPGRMRGGAPDLYFDRTVIVNKTPRECYDYWRDLRNIANFTHRLETVTPLDE